ncbi:TerB N-terminal domain-containing protein [Undibacterium sp. 5I1]|uniref:tellurite resistance TerB family protein n=1 Tax=Undibacterium sp. 5I1 TaxID=3048590 RepID=UPI002B22FE66|nr:TerB N-terminal domain-containing protein [Undibacterium sp. 5I1]MEB0258448.1 TerB N-terminal domain-containing protein [Undibacterium sp. 5I1]
MKTALRLDKSESITIEGIEIPGGEVYVEPSLTATNGRVEPALVGQRKALFYAIYRYYLHSQKSQGNNVPHSAANPSPSHIGQAYPATSTSSTWSTQPVSQPQSGGNAAPLVEDELTSFSSSTNPARVDDYKIPVTPSEFKTARWLDKSESITLAGIEISGGKVYVGPSLTAANGGVEPSLIDPRKNVAKNGHYTERHTNYWPNYSDISPQARRAYLLWLADGRSAPDADIGYVFLYFYGLERRIILDILREKQAQDELPEIALELKRLYATYADGSNSFKMYCGQLIEIVDAANQSSRLYVEDLGDLPPSYGLPLPLRVAIGQAVRDGVPIPMRLALAWAERDPAISRKTPVQRCSDEFKKLFASEYAKAFGQGLKIAPNKTKIRLSYRPASGGFMGSTGVDMKFGDTPDVTALTAPVKKLQAVVDSCTKLLEPYSRYLARNPEGRHDLEAVLTLPLEFWPDTSRQAIGDIKLKVNNGLVVLKFKELFATFKATGELTKDKQQALASALEAGGIGIEPDVLGSNRASKPEDPLVLFQTNIRAQEIRDNPAYKVAKISVELAAAVAHADGDFSEAELNHLNLYIDKWNHLNIESRLRLKAYAQVLVNSSVALSSIKKKVELLDQQTREAIAAFAAAMVLADGVPLPEEVKLLEKIYLQLGLERTTAYSDIHAGHAVAKMPAQSPSVSAPGFTLDQSKIAALKESSDMIAQRLAAIFVEDTVPESAPAEIRAEHPQSNTILGLDESHSAFARLLVSRSTWERAELLDVAQDLNIMLDGALEKLNEASLDELDTTFTDGNDPIEINAEMIESLTQ